MFLKEARKAKGEGRRDLHLRVGPQTPSPLHRHRPHRQRPQQVRGRGCLIYHPAIAPCIDCTLCPTHHTLVCLCVLTCSGPGSRAGGAAASVAGQAGRPGRDGGHGDWHRGELRGGLCWSDGGRPHTAQRQVRLLRLPGFEQEMLFVVEIVFFMHKWGVGQLGSGFAYRA